MHQHPTVLDTLTSGGPRPGAGHLRVGPTPGTLRSTSRFEAGVPGLTWRGPSDRQDVLVGLFLRKGKEEPLP